MLLKRVYDINLNSLGVNPPLTHPRRLTKSEVRSQKRCDPATTPARLRNAHSCESEVIFVTGI
ncbi:MAG: hypothetical protein F6K24_09015 [Okeania sp. SIO2D1]|nr:hypothetical protein [Okeania sp. SIO2D1]